jgi:outer membrane protein OmpA-like peptidoglycan-associated protein
LEEEGTNSRGNLRTLYKSIIEGLGGEVIYMDLAMAGDNTSVDTEYKVKLTIFDESEPVAWETDEMGETTEWHFMDVDGNVQFIPDKATFKDRASVIEKLKMIAEVLNQDSSIKISITGYVAQVGAPDGKYKGSLDSRRAKAVSDILINELEVDNAQIVSVAGGGPGTFADERRADGSFDESIAPQNRVVVIKKVL